MEWAQRERELEVRREQQRRAQIDQERSERLRAETRLWRELQDSRSYLAALKDGLGELEPPE